MPVSSQGLPRPHALWTVFPSRCASSLHPIPGPVSRAELTHELLGHTVPPGSALFLPCLLLPQSGCPGPCVREPPPHARPCLRIGGTLPHTPSGANDDDIPRVRGLSLAASATSRPCSLSPSLQASWAPAPPRPWKVPLCCPLPHICHCPSMSGAAARLLSRPMNSTPRHRLPRPVVRENCQGLEPSLVPLLTSHLELLRPISIPSLHVDGPQV